ncbi:MAG: Fic family protein [Acidimicrobiales bacterium]
MKDSKWARGSNQYVKRAGAIRADSRRESTLILPTEDTRRQIKDTGVSWTPFDIERIHPSDVERIRHRFRAHLPELIWNTAALEGNNFTLPEVKTLLDGVTVGGRRLDDAEQILALNDAYNRLDEMVGADEFELTKSVSDELHALLARHEAIESGSFRGEGAVTGGGAVHLASGGVVEGTPHGAGGESLRAHFDHLVAYLAAVDDPRRRALIYFASAVRRQFYFDGNKRTARLMMTGELMSSGFEVVSVPFARKLEFNEALDALFSRDDATDLLRFLATCTLG